jgi:eukaryotic-like serine/threonine-protein kinase
MTITRRDCLASAGLLLPLLATAEGGLAGDWRAPLTHPRFPGDTTTLGLRLLPTAAGGLEARLSVPAIHAWEVPVGAAEVQGDQLLLMGGRWTLQRSRDGHHLLGAVPQFLSPRQGLPAVFERGGLVRPVRDPAGLPAPTVRWRLPLGAPAWADLLRMGDTVWAGDDAGRLHAVDTASGKLRWRAETGAALRTQPTLAGDLLLVNSDDGQLHALAAADGRAQWRLRLQPEPIQRTTAGGPGAHHDRFGAAAVVHGDLLVTACHVGELAAWSLADRRLRWKADLGGPLLGTPALADGRVIVGGFDGSVRAFELDAGREAWRFDTGGPVVSAPWVVDGCAIVGSRSYQLFGLDLADGRERWRRQTWFSWIESSATGGSGQGFVGSSDTAALSSFDPATGRLLWRRDVYGWAWARPALDARRVAIGASSNGGTRGPGRDQRGGVSCFERRSGRPLWRLPLEQPGDGPQGVTAGLALAADGAVLASTVSGELLALA